MAYVNALWAEGVNMSFCIDFWYYGGL